MSLYVAITFLRIISWNRVILAEDSSETIWYTECCSLRLRRCICRSCQLATILSFDRGPPRLFSGTDTGQEVLWMAKEYYNYICTHIYQQDTTYTYQQYLHFSRYTYTLYIFIPPHLSFSGPLTWCVIHIYIYIIVYKNVHMYLFMYANVIWWNVGCFSLPFNHGK